MIEYQRDNTRNKTNMNSIMTILFLATDHLFPVNFAHKESKSPSSQLVTGHMVQCSRGAFDILTKLSS